MSTCSSCNKAFDATSVIAVCNICNSLFHSTPTCAGVTASEIKVLELKKSKPLLVYKCVECHESGNTHASLQEVVYDLKEFVNALRKDMGKVKEEVKHLKSEIIPEIKNEVSSINKDLNTHISSCTDRFSALEDVHIQTSRKIDNLTLNPSTSMDLTEATIKEINDRQRREKNLLIFNVPDTNSLLVDVKTVNDILHSLDLSPREIKRLGVFNNTNRPILAKMNNTEDLVKVLKNWKSLPTEFRYSSDHSPAQRSLYNKLKVEVEQHNAAHANKKIVKFIKGTPTILDSAAQIHPKN